MKNPRTKKPFSTLAERLKKIRQRPPTQEQMDRMNEVFRRIDKEREGSRKNDKVARSPEMGD